jgi:hypothetical protein
MQPQAWFIRNPLGVRFGPCYTEWQAKVEAGRIAATRPKLEPETAFILWRSLAKMGWKVTSTNTKLIEMPTILRTAG